VGANGSRLVTKGDISGHIEVGNNIYPGRFTLIDDLCYDVILGNDLLQNLGFYIDPDGTHVKIAGTKLSRVFELDHMNAIQTPITCPSLNAKLLRMTDTRECDGRLTEDYNERTESFAFDHRQKTINRPDTTYPVNSISNSVQMTKEFGLVQFVEPPDTVVAIVQSPNFPPTEKEFGSQIRRSVSSDLGSKEDAGILSNMTEACAIKEHDRTVTENHREDKLFKYAITDMDKQTTETETDHLRRLLRSFIDIFSNDDDDIGLFRASDGGPSQITLHLKDTTKICYSVPRRVPYGRREWLRNNLQKNN